MRTKRLGDMLIELGLLTNDQLKQAPGISGKRKGPSGNHSGKNIILLRNIS